MNFISLMRYRVFYSLKFVDWFCNSIRFILKRNLYLLVEWKWSATEKPTTENLAIEKELIEQRKVQEEKHEI